MTVYPGKGGKHVTLLMAVTDPTVTRPTARKENVGQK
jgi:hypothetical protein